MVAQGHYQLQCQGACNTEVLAREMTLSSRFTPFGLLGLSIGGSRASNYKFALVTILTAYFFNNMRCLPSRLSAGSVWIVSCNKTPRPSPVLFQDAHVVDRHAPVHGLAHVVDSKQGHLHGSEGFHLYTGLANGFYRC